MDTVNTYCAGSGINENTIQSQITSQKRIFAVHEPEFSVQSMQSIQVVVEIDIFQQKLLDKVGVNQQNVAVQQFRLL